ncbi:hypothetical protein BOTCAL_0191g00050 [Botryotinia calthae]|uniref:Uncharacterized protein n=1 Tax=Botryotinia calthae TaxID=38488 RepID=A0A4Y8D221_9HELO|nr:hypothetical protein BOTCAL_0191g00050 [Botryotinia calthae]
MFSTVLTSPLNTHATDLKEPNWSEEKPPPYNSTSSYLTGPDRFDDLHLDDPKDTNDDIYNKTAQASTGWTNTSEVTISPPSQVYFTDMKSQATITQAPFSESQWSQEQTLPISKPPQVQQTKIEESNSQSDIKAPQSSTWWSARWSTTWAHAFGETITTPNPVHIPSETALDNTFSGTLNHNTSLPGRNPHQGFPQTKKLLATQLMNRLAPNNSSLHTSINFYEALTPELRNPYEQAASSFIELVQNLILQSEGPNRRVDDWMILGILDSKYKIVKEGEKKPYLYGEWEYLWAIHADEIATSENAMLGKESRACNSGRDGGVWRMEYRIPTREDWKWWCGEWKKVPGAMGEWKPREEVWPWQRRYWIGL